jgi:hypothetical protein
VEQYGKIEQMIQAGLE